MSKETVLGTEAWRRVLERLSESLAEGPRVRMIVIGGVAFALAYDSRRTTRDLDAVLDPADAPRIIAAAEEIGPEFGLPSGWLNEKAKEAKLLPLQTADYVRLLFKVGCIDILTPGDEPLLAMKLMAYRGKPDRDDALILLRRMKESGLDAEDVWTRVGGFVLAQKRQNTRLNFDELWDLLDESV